jgi:hypothetical protein
VVKKRSAGSALVLQVLMLVALVVYGRPAIAAETQPTPFEATATSFTLWAHDFASDGARADARALLNRYTPAGLDLGAVNSASAGPLPGFTQGELALVGQLGAIDLSSLRASNAEEAAQLADLQRVFGTGSPLRTSLQKLGLLVTAPGFQGAAANARVSIVPDPTEAAAGTASLAGLPSAVDATSAPSGASLAAVATPAPIRDIIGFVSTVAGILLTLAGAVLACNSAPPFSEGICVTLAVLAAVAFLIAAVTAFFGAVSYLIREFVALANRIAGNVQRYADDSKARAQAYIAGLRNRLRNVIFGCGVLLACPV